MEATVWTPLHLFEANLYNGPSLSHGVYICSSLLLMVSWQVPHLSTGSRPDFNNDPGADSNSGPVLGPGVYLNLTQIMIPPWATPIFNDFNNGPGNDLNSTCILALQCLFETDANNDPPQAIPNPVSDAEYICSGILLMVFWWVPNSSTVSLFNVFTKNITKHSRLFCCR